MSASSSPPINRGADFPPLGEVLEFLRLIWALAHALETSSRRMEESLGVTGPQRMVLRMIGRFPGILPTQLAQVLHVHPSTLTGILKRLERRAFIMRRPHPRDQRRTLLGLRAKGRALDQQTEGTVEAALQVAFAEIPPDKIRAAADVLSTITAVLHETAANGDALDETSER